MTAVGRLGEGCLREMLSHQGSIALQPPARLDFERRIQVKILYLFKANQLLFNLNIKGEVSLATPGSFPFDFSWI